MVISIKVVVIMIRVLWFVVDGLIIDGLMILVSGKIVSRLKMFEFIILFNVKLFLFFNILVIYVVSLGRLVLIVIIVKLIIRFERLKYLVILMVDLIKKCELIGKSIILIISYRIVDLVLILLGIFLYVLFMKGLLFWFLVCKDIIIKFVMKIIKVRVNVIFLVNEK